MKRGMSFSGFDSYSFGPDNKLRIFPPNSYKFKPKDHIVLDEAQECILDNFWYMFNNKKDDKGYMLSILNSLAEYFNNINGIIPSSENIEVPEERPLYLLYDGKVPGIYTSFELILAEKVGAKYTGGVGWKKYKKIDTLLEEARKVLGINYYIEPAAKEYIQQYKKALNKNNVPENPIIKVKEEASSSKKPTYKESLVKGMDPFHKEYIDNKIEEKLEQIHKEWLFRGVDPLDGEYIDKKFEDKFEQLYPDFKKEIKDDILKEVQKEMAENFEKLKKEYETSFDFSQFMNEYSENKPDEKMEELIKSDEKMEESQNPE